MEKFTYLIHGGNKKYKIGRSANPEKRLQGLRTAWPECRLICYGIGRTEKQLHDIFAKFKFQREWFILQTFQVEMIIKLINGNEGSRELLKSANYRAEAKREKHKNGYKFTFGKYKGKRVCDVGDRNYFIWLLQQPNFSENCPALAKIIHQQVNQH